MITKVQYKDFAANLVTAEYLYSPVGNVSFRSVESGRLLLNPIMGVSTWCTFLSGLFNDKASEVVVLKETE